MPKGVPIREIARELGLSRNTIRRYARATRVPIDRSPPTRSTPARDGVEEAAASLWQSRRSFTAGKQRLTATRLWELLRESGHTASERTVRRLVAEFRSAEREVTVPLVYAPGEAAQVDFFEVWVELEGARQKSWLFLMRLMHSGRDFAMLCDRQDTTWFLAAHVAAFTPLRRGRLGSRVRQPDRRGRQGPGRRATCPAAAIRGARGALRVRAALLPSRRRPRQGRRRATRRTHSVAARGPAAAWVVARRDERGPPGPHRRAARRGHVAVRIVVPRARRVAGPSTGVRRPARSRGQAPSSRDPCRRGRRLLRAEPLVRADRGPLRGHRHGDLRARRRDRIPSAGRLRWPEHRLSPLARAAVA
jgi:hypothetical protein